MKINTAEQVEFARGVLAGRRQAFLDVIRRELKTPCAAAKHARRFSHKAYRRGWYRGYELGMVLAILGKDAKNVFTPENVDHFDPTPGGEQDPLHPDAGSPQ